MAENDQRRGGFAGATFAAVAVGLMVYLTFAALQGEHGLFKLFQVEAQEKQLEAELAGLRRAREEIANRTRRLSTGTLDLDLLDEQARKTLGLGRPDEIIIR